MHSYRILSNEQLIVLTWTGDVRLADYIDLCRRIIGDSNYSDQNSVVFDFRKSRIQLSLEELKIVANKYIEADCFHGPKVLLVNRSVDTAKIMIFRDHVGHNHRFSVYCTLEGASSFLQSDLSRFLEEDSPVREDVYIDHSQKRTRSVDARLSPNSLS